MSTSFEVSGGPHLLKGELYHANIHEVTDPTVPTNIIRIDQDWFIHLKWAQILSTPRRYLAKKDNSVR
jgi:hypothetical protein